MNVKVWYLPFYLAALRRLLLLPHSLQTGLKARYSQTFAMCIIMSKAGNTRLLV